MAHDSAVDIDFSNARVRERANNYDEVLLLHFDGADAATTTEDKARQHPVTFVGNAQLDTAQFKFGASSCLFDGSGDYLELDGSNDFAFGSGDFTIDLWIRRSVTGSSLHSIFDTHPTGLDGSYISIQISALDKLAYYSGGSTRITGTTSLAADIWYHIALTRFGSSTKLFLNGIQEGSTYSDSTTYSVGPSRPRIGSTDFTGWIDELRVVKGRALFPNNGFTPPTQAYGDKFPVHLLLHMDGTDGAVTFPDHAGRHQPLSVNGAQVDTAQSKFGGASLLLDGVNDYLRLGSGDWAFGSDWTFDFWIRFNSVSTGSDQRILDFRQAGASTDDPVLTFVDSTNVFSFGWGGGAGFDATSGTTVITTNTWYHVAWTRQGRVNRLFLNGVLEASAVMLSDAAIGSYDGGPFLGSANNVAGVSLVDGWIDELRFIKNYAAWDGTNATPANTKLLLHMDGADASTTFTDSILSGAHTVTVNGSAQVDTAQSKFGGASCLCDASGDYLDLDGSSDFAFGTGDFTIDCWIRLDNINTFNNIIDWRAADDGNPHPVIYVQGSDSKMRFRHSTIDRITGTTALSADTWYHIALTRSGTSTKLFLNGVQEGSTYTDSTNYTVTTNKPRIGASFGGVDGLDGWIDEVRIVKGTAIWTAAFTPPTAPYVMQVFTPPTSAYAMNYQRDTNQVLLCHFNGPDASTSFSDATGRHLLTATGNVQIDTAQSKFGGASCLFDGTGDYLDLDSTADFAFGTGDFTIDLWLRLNAVGTTQSIYDPRSADPDANAFNFFVFSDGTVGFRVNGSNVMISSTALSTATWYHIAFTRSSGSTRMFINGVQESSTYSDSNNYSPAVPPRIGANFSAANSVNGWIDGFRVLKGVAAWVGDFMPPWVLHRAKEPIPQNFISTSRASVGYHKTRSGTLVKYGNNEPRISDIGLLVEDARTNEMWHSQEIDDAFWAKNNLTVTANQAVAPDGTTTMDLCDEGTANDRHGFEHQISTNTNVPTAVSFFAKDVDRRYVHFQQHNAASDRAFVYADLQTGTITDSGVSGASIVLNSFGIESFANKTYRIWMVVTSAAQSLEFLGIYLSDRPDDSTGSFSFVAPSYTGTNKKIYIWGIQFEDGSFPSSYIPTTSASATRAADNITVIGGLNSVIGSSAVSAVMDIKGTSGVGTNNVIDINRYLLTTAGVGGNNLLSYDRGGSDVFQNWNGTSNLTHQIVPFQTTGIAIDAGIRAGVAGNTSGRSITSSGDTPDSDSNPLGTAPNTKLGETGTGWMHCRRLSVWNYKIPNATLQSLTT